MKTIEGRAAKTWLVAAEAAEEMGADNTLISSARHRMGAPGYNRTSLRMRLPLF